MEVGVFGTRQVIHDTTAADNLYRKAKAKHGDRQGSYVTQVCRLVLNHAGRHTKAASIKHKHNSFSGMGIKASIGTGRDAGGIRSVPRHGAPDGQAEHGCSRYAVIQVLPARL